MNEKVIGNVFRKWIESGKIIRSDLFITTKLPPFGNRASDVEKCLKKSVADLQCEYLDLYLIHVPFAVPYTEGLFEKHPNGDLVFSETNHVETWKVKIDSVDDKKFTSHRKMINISQLTSINKLKSSLF